MQKVTVTEAAELTTEEFIRRESDVQVNLVAARPGDEFEHEVTVLIADHLAVLAHLTAPRSDTLTQTLEMEEVAVSLALLSVAKDGDGGQVVAVVEEQTVVRGASAAELQVDIVRPPDNFQHEVTVLIADSIAITASVYAAVTGRAYTVRPFQPPYRPQTKLVPSRLD